MGVNLSFSTNSIARRGSSSSSFLPREGSAYSSLVSGGGVVPQPIEKVPGPFSAARFLGPVSGNLPRQGGSPEPFRLQASRVETIRQGLRRKGYSWSAIGKIVGACRESTNKQYQSAWKLFWNYLSAQEIEHNRVSIPVVLDFLDYYCTAFEREYRTLSVYKCALRHPLLWACDLDIEGIDITAHFMRGVFNFNPPHLRRLRSSQSGPSLNSLSS